MSSSFLQRCARVRHWFIIMKFFYISPFRLQTKQFHAIIHTFSPNLPTPTLHSCHLHISTGWHPIIHTHMLQMPKTTSIYHASPHWSAMLWIEWPHSTLRFLSLSDTTHPSHHHLLHQPSISLVSVPNVNTLWTQALYIFPLIWYDALQAVGEITSWT